MLKVYTGPMFSGKSTALINEYDNIIDKENAICFKPSKDTRDKTQIRARNVKEKVNAIVIKSFEEILGYLKSTTKYIFIDEVQFLEGNYCLLDSISKKLNIDVIVSGLHLTSELNSFGFTKDLMMLADKVVFLAARCEDCGENADYTYCLSNKNTDILVGDKEKYIPLCRACYIKRRNKYGY